MKSDFHLGETIEKFIKEEGLKAVLGILNLVRYLEKENFLMAIASSSSLKDIQKIIKLFSYRRFK